MRVMAMAMAVADLVILMRNQDAIVLIVGK